jgi:hypothetical protein
MGGPELKDFTALINGKSYSIEQKKEILKVWGNAPYEAEYRMWHIWKMTFPPKKIVKIENSYTQILGSNSGYTDLYLRYTLSTGANWKDKIDSIKVIVTYKDEKDLINRIYDIQPKGWVRKGNKIIWDLKNIEPTEQDNIKITEKQLGDSIGHSSYELYFSSPMGLKYKNEH